MRIYAVVDKKAKSIASVFGSVSDEAAKRSFLALITGPENIFTQFPEDFSLFALADFSVVGSSISCSRPGSDVLHENGFTADSFLISDSLDDGANYDKRYLAMVHQDRVSYEIVSEEKIEEDSK